jgi:hypothetical protein
MTCPFHQDTGRDHREQRPGCGHGVRPPAPCRPDRVLQLDLFLSDSRLQPRPPVPRQPETFQSQSFGAEQDHVQRQDCRRQHQSGGDGQHSGDDGHAHDRYPQGDHAAQRHHLAVQGEPAGDDRAQPQQRRQVEDVRAQHDPRADVLLVTGDRGDRGRDLRGVRGQRRHDPQQRLRQTQPLPEPFDARHQKPARCQAHDNPGGEDCYRGHDDAPSTPPAPVTLDRTPPRTPDRPRQAPSRNR